MRGQWAGWSAADCVKCDRLGDEGTCTARSRLKIGTQVAHVARLTH